MKIAILSTSYPRFDGDPSGHFVQADAERWARSGARVAVLVPGSGGPAPTGGERHSLGAGDLFDWPGALARARERPVRLLQAGPFVLRARRALRVHGPWDRVVANFIVPSAWPACLGVDAPLEVRAHGADVRLLAALPRRFAGHVISTLLERGAAFVFAASSLRRTLLEALPAGVATRLFEASTVELPPLEMPARDALPSPAAELGTSDAYAVWVGRRVPEKRPALAARAALAANVPIVFVGDGPEPLPPGVLVVGRVDREVALGWIAGARVLVSTSRDEAAPSAVREARALGVAVLSTPAGDVAEWARSDPGIQIFESERALRDALRERFTRTSVTPSRRTCP